MKNDGLAADLFPTDAPVPHAMIGRGDDVTRLEGLLFQGLNQLVAGPRRQGKTTLCKAVLGRLRAEGRYVVDVDLFASPGLVQLADAIVAGTVENRPGLRRAGHGIVKGAALAATAVSGALSARLRAELGAGIEMVFEPGRVKSTDPLTYLQHAVRLLERLSAKDGAPAVLFLDELQDLAQARGAFGDPDAVMNVLRAELQMCPHVTTLFTGSVAHLMRDLFGDEHRAFYLWGAWFDLSPIPPETWSDGLARRVEEAGLHFDPRALGRLVDLGELQARTTMLLAQQAFLYARSEENDTIDLVAVEAAADLAMRADAMAHELAIRRAKQTGRYAFDVLLHVAAGQAPYHVGRPSDAKRALDALAADGLVERRGPEHRGGWVVVDPLFRRRLRQLDP